jgi:hypothetical protein
VGSSKVAAGVMAASGGPSACGISYTYPVKVSPPSVAAFARTRGDADPRSGERGYQTDTLYGYMYQATSNSDGASAWVAVKPISSPTVAATLICCWSRSMGVRLRGTSRSGPATTAKISWAVLEPKWCW